MNSIQELWEMVLNTMEESGVLTDTARQTWFAEMEPLALSDGKLILYTPSEFKGNWVLGRFSDTIRKLLSDIFSEPFEFELLRGEAALNQYRAVNGIEKKNICSDIPEMDGFDFRNFIVGSSNEHAYAAAVRVSEEPGAPLFNPLLIYGESGLGKTHLLLSIGAAVHKKFPDKKIVYVKSTDFVSELVTAIHHGSTEQFREKYRPADLFLMDDVQFLAGKEATQTEFFDTFNAIYRPGRQIVMTSDRTPKDMPSLEARIRSRMESSAMVDVRPPDVETRAAIVRSKAETLGVPLPPDVVAYVAETITSNIRQIEGAVRSLAARQNFSSGGLTVEEAQRVMANVVREGLFVPTPSIIATETAAWFGITYADMMSDKRGRTITPARQVAMYLTRTLTELSLEDIGEYFHRDHTTVMASVSKVESKLLTDRATEKSVREITANINRKNR